jgi:hypothetical protein
VVATASLLPRDPAAAAAAREFVDVRLQEMLAAFAAV